MKTANYIWTLLILLAFTACHPNNPVNPDPDPKDTIAAPHWVAMAPEVEPTSWQYNLDDADLTATMTFTMSITGQSGLVLSENDRVGLFLEDRCLTQDTLSEVYEGTWRAFLVLPYYASLEQLGEKVYAAYYNATLSRTFYWQCGVEFVTDGEVGTFKEPFLLNMEQAFSTPFSTELSFTLPAEMRAQYHPEDEMAVFVNNECHAVADLSKLPVTSACSVVLPMGAKEEDIVFAYFSARQKCIRRSAPVHISSTKDIHVFNPITF